MSSSLAVGEGCRAEVFVVSLYRTRSCRHSCGLDMLRPVRQRMRVPVWVKERSEGLLDVISVSIPYLLVDSPDTAANHIPLLSACLPASPLSAPLNAQVHSLHQHCKQFIKNKQNYCKCIFLNTASIMFDCMFFYCFPYSFHLTLMKK